MRRVYNDNTCFRTHLRLVSISLPKGPRLRGVVAGPSGSLSSLVSSVIPPDRERKNKEGKKNFVTPLGGLTGCPGNLCYLSRSESASPHLSDPRRPSDLTWCVQPPYACQYTPAPRLDFFTKGAALAWGSCGSLRQLIFTRV